MSEYLSQKYTGYLNKEILPYIDYEKLSDSYSTDMVYAMGLLNRLHEAMVLIYGGEQLPALGPHEDFVIVPGVLMNRSTEYMCVALFSLDISAGCEHWETYFFCKYGVISQTRDENPTLQQALKDLYIPYAYGYTADISGDFHVDKEKLPDKIKTVFKEFRHVSIELLPNEDEG